MSDQACTLIVVFGILIVTSICFIVGIYRVLTANIDEE